MRRALARASRIARTRPRLAQALAALPIVPALPAAVALVTVEALPGPQERGAT